MKNNKKLGQALIEYILLLAIPLLIISVLPNLNKTLNMTLNNVGVDLLEDEGGIPAPVPDFCPEGLCDPEDIVLHPPVAKFELPDNGCGQNVDAVYRKGSQIRIQDLSYDTDPNGEGIIDHTEWTVDKYYPEGGLVPECSTSIREEKLKGSRIAGSDSEVIGLTIDMKGYGGLGQYRNCTRDPGTFIVTLKVFDNDGLVSANTFTETFEIRDLRPSITVSVSVDNLARPDDDPADYVSASSISDSCRFDTPINNDYDDHNGYGIPKVNFVGPDDNIFTYRGRDYIYTEVCPRSESTNKNGKVVFRIEDMNYNGNNFQNRLKDPDFFAGDNGGENNVTAEGADDTLYGFERHGFTYLSRYTQSEALTPAGLATANAQEIYFETGATEYIKEFENPGIYLYDAMVTDENLISAQGRGAQNPTKAGYAADVGVAIKVLNPADEGYENRCQPIPEEIECPKPQYVLGMTKTNVNGDRIGPYYFSHGLVNATANDLNLLEIKDAEGNSIRNRFITDIQTLRNSLNMDILYPINHRYTGGSVQIPVFRPVNDEHLEIHSLTYYPLDDLRHEECKSAGSNKYWATTDGWINDFDFSTMKSGTNALWRPGSKPGEEWFTIDRPYKENHYLYFSNQTVEQLNTEKVPSSTAALIKDERGNVIEKVELLFGMARNNAAEEDFSDTIASPFNGKINSSDYTELLTATIERSPGEINEYKNSALRSNGQMIAIAPKLQSCPTHDLRPIPTFSYVTSSNQILQLSPATKGIEPDLKTWNIDTKNPPQGMTCTKEGCFVSITASNSICGPEAENCSIKALRWKYSMYTHKPINTNKPALEESDIKNAEPIVIDETFSRYFPLTTLSTQHNQISSDYPKYNSLFYPFGEPISRYRVTTLDDDVDTVYSLPTNHNTSGSYIYYGEYGSSEELATENGTKRISTPTFDFVSGTYNQIKDSGSIAPNARETYDSNDSINIPDGNNTPGMFLQAGTTYVYTIEVIDSQGCATSKTLTINVSDATKEPVAYCNFIDNKVDQEKLANYTYYDGLLVQGRTPNGTIKMFYNGDKILRRNQGNRFTKEVELYTSPLLMYNSELNKNDIASKDENLIHYDDINGSNFANDYDVNAFIAQELQEPGIYNPRVGQIPVNTTSLDNILNAQYSITGAGATWSESARSINKVTWSVYKADLDVSPDERGNLIRNTIEIPNARNGLTGTDFVKSGNNAEPIAVVETGSTEDFPTFPAGTFSQEGYYIIDVTVSYEKDGETLVSQPTACKMKVTSPILDFKCPWGETFEELRYSALQLIKTDTGIQPTQDAASILQEKANHMFSNLENGQLVAANNYNPAITSIEFTTNISKDINNLDTVESNNYSNVTLVDFNKNKLNDFWYKMTHYGFKIDGLYHVPCTAAEKAADDALTDPDDAQCRSFYDWLDQMYYSAFVGKPSSTVFSADTLQPLTITTADGKSETMHLQSWIVRERLHRDNALGSITPAFVTSIPGITAEEINLINQPLTGDQTTVLDTLIQELSSASLAPASGLYNLREQKIRIANYLKYSSKEKFTILDLQPTNYMAATFGESGDNGLFTLYTGVDNKFDLNCTNNNGSIRNCNYPTSNAYGRLSNYELTPFAGKYYAAKRFEDLNYDYSNQVSGGDFISYNVKNPVYILDEQTMSDWSDEGSKKGTVRSAALSYKNYYLNPNTVYLNQQGINTDGLTFQNTKSSNIFSLEQFKTTDRIGILYEQLPSTLDANSEFLNSRNSAEYNVDTEDLNAVTWQHGFNLGWYGSGLALANGQEEKNREAAITYLRVNVGDAYNTKTIETTNGSKTVFNNYSKLCPVLVEIVSENEMREPICNIGFHNVSQGVVYSPDYKNGYMSVDGKFLVPFYDSTYNSSNAIALNNSTTYTRTASKDSQLLTPKSLPSTENSSYNLADILFDWQATYDFIFYNQMTKLGSAEYEFFFGKTENSGRKINNVKLNIVYNLSGDQLSHEEIVAKIDDVRSQFSSQFYQADGFTPKYSSSFSDTNPTKVSEEDTGAGLWEYDYMTYKITYKDQNGKIMEGPSAMTSCNFAIANRKIPDPPGTDPYPYFMEIGSWDYRIQYPGEMMAHWDRTYDYNWRQNTYEDGTGKSMVTLPDGHTNDRCLWKIAPVSRSGYSGTYKAASSAATKYLGGYNHTDVQEGCKVNKSITGQREITITHGQAARQGIATNYSLLNSNENPDTYPGFYWVELFVTHSRNATSNEISSKCHNGLVGNNSLTNGDGNAWCYKGTLYVMTNNSNIVPGLTGMQVIEIIMNDDGYSLKSAQEAAEGTVKRAFYNAQKNRVDTYHGN